MVARFSVTCNTENCPPTTMPQPESKPNQEIFASPTICIYLAFIQNFHGNYSGSQHIQNTVKKTPPRLAIKPCLTIIRSISSGLGIPGRQKVSVDASRPFVLS